jgi:putative sterol carrier protein
MNVARTTAARKGAIAARTQQGAAARAMAPARQSATVFVSETLGKASSIKQRFDTMVSRFIPSKAKGVDERYQFDLSGSGGGQWYVEIKGGKITVKPGKGPNPSVTLKADAGDYLKIANGEMSKTWAFIRGKLKIDGDKDVLKDFDSYFKPL